MLTEIDDKNLIKITPEWMKEKFFEMNKLLFGNLLKECKFSIFTSGKGSKGRILGLFEINKRPEVIFKRTRNGGIQAYARDNWGDSTIITEEDFSYYLNPEIKLNGNYNWTEKAALSTLVHEMCHYYVSDSGYFPPRHHGPEFMRVARMVSAKSNDFFTVERVASADQMTQMDFTDEFKDFNNKRAAKGVHVIKFELSKPETSRKTGKTYNYGYIIPTSTKVKPIIDWVETTKYIKWAVDCITTDGTIKRYKAISSVGAYYYVDSLDKITPDVKFDSETIIKGDNTNSSTIDKLVAESRKNDNGETVPEICDKCGGKVVLQIHGEPVYICKDCGKYFGTMPFPSRLTENKKSIMRKIYINEEAFNKIINSQLKEETQEQQFSELLAKNGINPDEVFREFWRIFDSCIEDADFEEIEGNSTINLQEYDGVANINVKDWFEDENGNNVYFTIIGELYGRIKQDRGTYDTPGYKEVTYQKFVVDAAEMKFNNVQLNMTASVDKAFKESYEGETH